MPTTLLAMSKAELQSVKECVGKSRAEGTYQNLLYSDKLLTEFVEDKGMTDIVIATIPEDLFEEYRFYLKKRGLATATMNRYLCWLSRLMYRAVGQLVPERKIEIHAHYNFAHHDDGHRFEPFPIVASRSSPSQSTRWTCQP